MCVHHGQMIHPGCILSVLLHIHIYQPLGIEAGAQQYVEPPKLARDDESCLLGFEDLLLLLSSSGCKFRQGFPSPKYPEMYCS